MSLKPFPLIPPRGTNESRHPEWLDPAVDNAAARKLIARIAHNSVGLATAQQIVRLLRAQRADGLRSSELRMERDLAERNKQSSRKGCVSASARHPFILRIFFGLIACLAPANLPAQAPQSLGQPVRSAIPVRVSFRTSDITVGAQTYRGLDRFHIVALRRADLTLLPGGDQTFVDAYSVNQFLAGVRGGSDADAIVLCGNNANDIYLGDVATSLEQFGAQTDLRGLRENVPFMFIGNGGLQTGQAHQTGYGNTDMSGSFVLDANNKYTFIQPDYLTYQIKTDGTIQIGDQAPYTVAGAARECTSSSGFHLVAVQRDVPSNLIKNEVYCPFSATGNDNPGEVNHLLADLQAVNANESILVFFAAFGAPFPTPSPSRDTSYPVGLELKKLGGYNETFLYAASGDTYQLVGSAPPPPNIRNPGIRSQESSSVYPGKPTGGINGILARGRRGNYYSPIDADLTGLANLDLYKILALPPTPFPHPDNAAELQAFQYINTQLCGSANCNVRQSYNDTLQSFPDWESTLRALRDPEHQDTFCPNPPDTPTTPFCVMRQELLTEFGNVDRTQKLFNSLSEIWTVNGSTTILSLLSAYQSIKNTVNADDSAPAPQIGLSVANLILTTASYIPDFGAIFGIADAAMNFTLGLTTDTNGTQVSSLDSTVAQLYTQTRDSFLLQGVALRTQSEFILHDYQKLTEVGQAIAAAKPGWTWQNGTSATIAKGMAPAIEQSLYRALMPAIYAIGSFDPNPNSKDWLNSAYTYQSWCNADGELCARPFGTNYALYTYPENSGPGTQNPDPGTQALWSGGNWLGISRRSTPTWQVWYDGLFKYKPQYEPPADSFMKQFFLPIKDGGLGVFRPAFFESWLPRATCAASVTPKSNGEVWGGCDWQGAVSPIQAPGQQLTKLTITVDRESRNGSQMALPITITNTGSDQANDIELTQISARTLTGSGAVTVNSPTFPISVGTLAPGGSTVVTLQLTIPPSVKKISLTEDGSVASGISGPLDRFSLGQVLFPNQ